MHYVSYIGSSYAAKNNLEKAVAELLTTNNRLLIEADKIDAFKTRLMTEIQQLEATHKRCKPIYATFNKSYSKNGDYYLYPHTPVFFYLLKTQN